MSLMAPLFFHCNYKASEKMKNKILPQFFFAEAEAASYEWVKKMWVV